MNTLFYYQDGSTRVVHRTISSEYLDTVAHDYRESLVPFVPVSVPPLKPEDRLKERLKVLTAKADYKKNLWTKDHNDQRSDFIRAFIGSRIPNWGSIRFKV